MSDERQDKIKRLEIGAPLDLPPVEEPIAELPQEEAALDPMPIIPVLPSAAIIGMQPRQAMRLAGQASRGRPKNSGKSREKVEPKGANRSFYFSDKEKLARFENIIEISERQGISPSSVVNSFISEFLKAYDKQRSEVEGSKPHTVVFKNVSILC